MKRQILSGVRDAAARMREAEPRAGARPAELIALGLERAAAAQLVRGITLAEQAGRATTEEGAAAARAAAREAFGRVVEAVEAIAT